MVQTRFSRGILPKKRYTEEVAIEGEEEEEFDQVMEEGSESEEELTGAKRKRGGKKKGKPAPGTKAKLAQRREEEESLGKEEEELVGESTGEAAEEGEGEEEQEEAVDVGPASKQPRVEEIAQEQGQEEEEEEEEEAERLEEEGEEEQAGQQGGEMEQPAETEAAQEHEPQAAAPPAFAELQESEGAEEGAEALPVMPEAEQQAPVGGAEQVSEQAEPEQGGFVGAEAAQGATERGAAVEEAQQEEIQASPAKPAEAAEEHEQGGGGAAATEEKKEEQEVPTIESGKLMFFYRPKVGVEEAESMSQVQRFYMIFLPERPGSKPRLAVVGKKRLPAVHRHERFFGFIEAVADSVEALTADLGPKTYETKTRGTRTLAAARALGEASYAIVDKSAGSGSATGRTHLVLHLEAPEQPGEVQAEFELPKEGSYVLQVKNPANQPPQGQIGLTEKAEFPKEKLEEFKDYAWIGALDPSLLEYERAEFLLVAASDQPKEELGGSAAELAGGVDSDEAALNLLKEEANVEKAGIDMQPVQTGEWA